MRPIVRFVLLAVVFLLCWVTSAAAARLHLIGNFDQPIFVTSDPANPDSLYIVERDGRVVRFENGTASVFADLTGLVACCEGERGLLSIALAPDFETSARFFAAYTGKPDAGGAEGDVHVDAFAAGGGGLVREPLFSIEHSAHANHNGGQLEFGPDGYLYASVGDGGGGGDPFESGQDPSSRLGKILRVEPRAGAEPGIWSYGLRNPWRFSFDRASGAMVVADVGQGAREEVDVAASPGPGLVGGQGINYGWNCREGFIAYSEPGASCSGATGFTDPVFDYPHADPENGSAHGCAITGGYVVRDPSVTDLYGRYVYADFCVGAIRSMLLPGVAGGLASGDRYEGLDVSGPTSFGEDSCGRVYVASSNGGVYRFEGETPAVCFPPQSAVQAAVASAKRKHLRVLLGIRRNRLERRLKLAFTVRVLPCAGEAGTRVQLKRGGRRVAAKRINQRCAAHFRLRITHRSTFRAVLPEAGYRSQARTIALAKPRP